MCCVAIMMPEPEGRALLESIKTTQPLELVCINFWSAKAGGKNVDVLVITDHFTKMAHAYPCHDQSARQMACQLWDRYFRVYGFPERIHVNQGANFKSHLVQELLQKAARSPRQPLITLWVMAMWSDSIELSVA